jgi:hypothetical protein
MPPRNPATRRSSRAPKLKEPEVSKGSSPGATKQLEYTLRLEPVIKTTMKKVFIHPAVFGDIEDTIGSRMALPQWG